jgi:hypothetical protein
LLRKIEFSDDLEIQKLQGHPKFHPQDPRLNKTISPTHEEILELVVHLIERLCTEELCLIMRWIENVIGGGVNVQRSQLSFVHLGKFAG